MSDRDQKLAIKELTQLGSVGPKMAVKIYQLGFATIESLKNADPYDMYLRYSDKVGGYADPCVEDVFRCAVAQATYKNLPRNLKKWWSWAPQRGKALSRLK